MITIVTHTPNDYSGVTKEKMIAAGLVKIENDFEHSEDFCGQGFGWAQTRYFFSDGYTTNDIKKFRKRVYNYQP